MSALKNILFLTTFWDKAPDLPMGPTLFEHCPVNNCFITNNRQELASVSLFDAVIFHMADLEILKPQDLPNQQDRIPNQRYVMFFMESPQHWTADFSRFNNFFNWTMTYRLDSDIPNPYGWIVPKLSDKSFVPTIDDIGQWDHWENFDYGEFAASLNSRPESFRALAHRPRRIAWIVSHCNSNSDRERYVSELRNYIPVDIFGKCGNRFCSAKGSSIQTCNDHVEQNYMFYLAFENSFCDQYVTEKLWMWLAMDIVPVVMGQADYAAITPPNSVINAGNFPEAMHLASYLKQVMENETHYLSYFWWKDFYEVNSNTKYRETKMNANSSKIIMPSYCKLCQMLNDPEEPTKVWDNINEWWSMTGGHCKPKGSFPWSKSRSLVEDRLINDFIIFAMSLLISLVIVILIASRLKVRFCYGKLLFTIPIFGLFFISVLCRASLEIPWNAHLVYTRFHKVEKVIGKLNNAFH